MNFGDILDEWDRETAKPYGKKKLKEDRDRAAREPGATDADEGVGLRAKTDDGTAKASAQPKATKKTGERSGPPKSSAPSVNPMEVWLRRYGTEDKDSAQKGGSSKSSGRSKSSKNPGELSDPPKSDERRANPMDVWLRRYGTLDKDAVLDGATDEVSPAERRRRLRAMRSEAVLDLHGLTRDEAWFRLEAFFADCMRRNLKKVLIIHGKGTHSEDDPVLGPLVKLFIEQNRHAGESGHSPKEEGGSGSTWVILK